VVASPRARRDHRRRRQGARRRCPLTTSLLGDAVAHHLGATEGLIDECAALTPEQLTTPAPGTYGSIIDTLRPSWLVSSSIAFTRHRPVKDARSRRRTS
jgi:hypothetical protein